MFDPEKPPELEVLRWVNASAPLSLERLKGRVVVLLAFQMLCPGCVEHAIPQARRLAERFNPEQVAVIGLHTVFEHHRVMTPEALEVFASEYRLPFPVAIDQPDGEGAPRSFTAYQMQGTPTLLLFDREGRLRRHYFGRPDDIMLAAEIMALAIEEKGAPRGEAARIERRIAATLVNPRDESAGDGHDHHHAHGDDCGCGHAHDHEHDHEHGHAHDHGHAHHHHDGECCGGGCHRHGTGERHAHHHDDAGIAAVRLAEGQQMTEPPKDISSRKDGR